MRAVAIRENKAHVAELESRLEKLANKNLVLQYYLEAKHSNRSACLTLKQCLLQSIAGIANDA